MRKVVLFLMVLASVSMWRIAYAAPPVPTDPGLETATRAGRTPIFWQNFDPLLERAKAAGTVRVIMALNIPGGHISDAKITNATARQKQREAIRATQERLMGLLGEGVVQVTGQFETIPHMGMRVTPDGLHGLARSALVRAVLPDRNFDISTNTSLGFMGATTPGVGLMGATTATGLYEGYVFAVDDPAESYKRIYTGAGKTVAIIDAGVYQGGLSYSNPEDYHPMVPPSKIGDRGYCFGHSYSEFVWPIANYEDGCLGGPVDERLYPGSENQVFYSHYITKFEGSHAGDSYDCYEEGYAWIPEDNNYRFPRVPVSPLSAGLQKGLRVVDVQCTHGTQMAAIAAGSLWQVDIKHPINGSVIGVKNYAGVARGASILPITISNIRQYGLRSEDSDFSIRTCPKEGSIGGYGDGTLIAVTSGNCYYKNQYEVDMIRALLQIYDITIDADPSNDVDAVNISMASSSTSNYLCDQTEMTGYETYEVHLFPGGPSGGKTAAMSDVTRDLWLKGVPTIAASGNNGRSNGVSSPGCLENTIAVGSVYEVAGRSIIDRTSSNVSANQVVGGWYSGNSGGSNYWGGYSNPVFGSDRFHPIDKRFVFAPGVDVIAGSVILDLSEGGLYDCYGLCLSSALEPNYPDDIRYASSGTSVAAAHVSGAMAVLKEVSPDASADRLYMALYNGALDETKNGEVMVSKFDNAYVPISAGASVDLKRSIEWLVKNLPENGKPIATNMWHNFTGYPIRNTEIYLTGLDDLNVVAGQPSIKITGDIPDRFTITQLPVAYDAALDAATGIVSIAKKAGYEGVTDKDVFKYTVTDGNGVQSPEATVVIYDYGISYPPSASTTFPGQSLSVAGGPVFGMQATESDLSATVEFFIATQTVFGEITFGSEVTCDEYSDHKICSQDLRYTPYVVDGVSQFNATNSVDTFEFVASNGKFISDPVTMTINFQDSVAPTANPDPTTALDPLFTTDEDVPVTLDVLINDDPNNTGAENKQLSIYSVDTLDTVGSVVFNSSYNTFTYTPLPEWNGTDTFNYTIVDDFYLSSTATVTVTVNPQGDPPVAVDDAATTGKDSTTPLSIDVLKNDSNFPLTNTVTYPPLIITPDAYLDDDGQKLTLLSVDSTGTIGAFTVDTTTSPYSPTYPNITYTPAASFTGTDTFAYTISDGDSNSTATVTITVLDTASVPVAGNDTATVEEGASVFIDVLANDTDGDPLTIKTVGTTLIGGVIPAGSVDPGNGNVSISPDGLQLRYTPGANYNGSDMFTYTVTDGYNVSSPATVDVTVTPVNSPPVITGSVVPVVYTTDEDTGVTTGNLLLNASDPEEDTLTVGASQESFFRGTVEPGTVAGTFIYTPPADFNGTDTFSYTITDGTSYTNGIVTVTVTPVNDPPVAVDDTALAVDENTPVTINVLANDTDVDWDTLSVSWVNNYTANGAPITNNGDGTVTFTPVKDCLTDSFNYTANDGNGGTDSAVGTVNVGCASMLPIIDRILETE